jgi:4-aminobutyrate aminotransferase-like enzyme
MLGADLDRPAADAATTALELGLVVGTAGERTLRLTPPLTITSEELEQGLALLAEALA